MLVLLWFLLHVRVDNVPQNSSKHGACHLVSRGQPLFRLHATIDIIIILTGRDYQIVSGLLTHSLLTRHTPEKLCNTCVLIFYIFVFRSIDIIIYSSHLFIFIFIALSVVQDSQEDWP